MKETNFTKLFSLCIMFFGVLITTNLMAQCPNGQTEVTVSMSAAGFPGENSWIMWDATAGAPLAGVNSNPGAAGAVACANTTASGEWVNGQSVSACVTNGNTIEVYGYESFGDNWNGAVLDIDATEDASAYTDGCQANDGFSFFSGTSLLPDDNDLTAGNGDGGIECDVISPGGTNQVGALITTFTTECLMCTIICPVDPVDGDSIFNATNDAGFCEGFVTIPPASQSGCSGLAIDDAPFVEFISIPGAGNIPLGSIMPIVFNGTAPAAANPADVVTVVITVDGDIDFCTAAGFEQFDLQNGGVSLINIAGVAGPAHNCQGNSYTAFQCVETDFTFTMDYATWITLGNTVDMVFLGGGTSRTLCGAPPNDGASGSASWAVPPSAFHDSPFALAPGDDASGTYPVGCTEVVFTTFAPGGVPVTCPIQVCVDDVEDPVIENCPGDLVFNLLPGECTIVVTYALGPATDNCPFAGSATSLNTDLVRGPGISGLNGCCGGNYFQMTNVGAAPIDVQSFCWQVSGNGFGGGPGGTGDFEVYTTAVGASYLGNECNAGAWTLLGAATGVTLGATFGVGAAITPGSTTEIPIGGLSVAPGTTIGIYITATAGVASTHYNQNPTATTFNDGNLQIDNGGSIAGGYPFCTGFTFGPQRAFSGGVKYEVATGSCTVPGVISQDDGTGLTSGMSFPIGTTPQGYTVCDNFANVGRCDFDVIVNEYPFATDVLATNDKVQVSLDPAGGCTLVSIDAILEGGPYGCYDNYYYSRTPAYNGPACATAPATTANAVPGCPGAPVDAAQGMIPFSCEDIGRTITVMIIDSRTCNKAWATVTVEDKIAPVITCDTTIIACTQEFEVGFQNSSSVGEIRGPLPVNGNVTEFEFDLLAPGDATITNVEVCFRLEHTWVDDLDIEIESPNGTVVTLFNGQGTIPDCQDGDNYEVCIGDQYAAFVHPTDCGPLNLTINGNYSPYNGTGIATAPMSTFNGTPAAGTWIFRTNDNFPGGDFGTLQWLDAKVAWAGTVGPSATDNCGPTDLTSVRLDSARTCSSSGVILQTWTATDWSGNQASCVSKVTIRKPSFNDLMLPDDLLLDCCTDEYPDPGANVVLKDVTTLTPARAITDGDNAVRYDFDLNQVASGERTIKDLNIRFDASHTDIRDLTIEIAQLTATGNVIASTRRTFYEGEIIYDASNNPIDAEYLLCSNSTFRDINATFDDEGCDVHEACVDFSPSVAGTYVPYQALSNFDGVLVNDPTKGADFTILVSDRNNNPNGVPPTDGSSGTVNTIEISYSYNDPTAVAGAFIDGRPISHNDKCGYSITYEDDVVDVCPTSYKVLRTWKIIDWCNNTKVEHEQTIKVIDTMAPVIAAPRTQNDDEDTVDIPVYEPATASTTHGACVGNVTLPEMGVCFEDCSGVASWNTYIFSADGVNLLDAKEGNGGMMNESLVLDLDEGPDDDVPMPEPIVITLPDGTRIIVTSIRLETLMEPDAIYLARYVVRDSCGNEGTADVFIRLIDRVAPVPICREETQLSLTGAPDQETTICADDLDEGSYDNCSNVHFFIRKMNDADDLDPICNVDFGLGPDPSLTFEILGDCETGAGAFTLAEHCKYTSCIEFGCDDIGEDNQVFLLVVDDYVVDFMNDYLDVVFPFIDAIVDYNTLPLTVLPADKCDDELDIFVTNPNFFWQADNDRRNQGKRYFEFYLNEDPNADALFVLPTAILWEGHYNFCMVNVHIEDKVRPTCSAPADVWINCDELPENVDYDDDAALDALFGEATASDNCNAKIQYVSVTNRLDLCGVGQVIRRWRAEDDYGNRSVGSCQQVIMVQPVTNYCITFPADFEGNCDNTNAPADLTFVENGCDLLAVSRDFEDFPAADNGECRKEIVTWKVINWCEYDGIADPTRIERDRNGDGRIDDGEYCSTGTILLYTPNPTQVNYPSTGYYEWKQHVKIFDDVAPEVSYDGADKFCGGDLDEDPCTGQVDIEIDITELCTDKLTTTWAISAFASTFGAADFDGSGSISMRLPLGTHTARFSATDDCGNTSQMDITFSVVDCKAPTPVCHNGLSIDVMPLSGMVELWANDFDASSFDYCSDFILRANVVEDRNGDGIITSDDYVTVLPPNDYILVDCDDVANGLTMVQLWVSEQDGTADDSCADNQDDDFCVTFVEVQDNNGVCSGSKVGLGGKIANENNESVENVSIEVNSSASMMGAVTTDASGEYEFLLPIGGDYTVTPMRNDDITNGVSTFDLVLISKHILNVQLLDSPYKVLAADANRSNGVSTLDLVAIRKAVLRVATEFPNNTSWRFVDKDQVLTTNTPWDVTIKEVINRNDLETADLNANFVAIKVGDVNGDATPNSILGVDDRSFNGNLVFSASEESVNAGEEFSVDFVAAQNVQGYQFTLDYDEKAVELVDIVDGLAKEAKNFNVIADQGLIATSWNEAQPTADATMFTLVFRAKANVEVSNIVTVSSEVTTAEAYNLDGDLMGISFEFGGQAQAATFELEQNTPNPFKSETTIGFTLPEASSATITISDVTGKVLKVVKGDYTEGYNTVTLKRSDLGVSAGVLSYQLDTPTNSATKQMIIIE